MRFLTLMPVLRAPAGGSVSLRLVNTLANTANQGSA
jgi:hypothetical protein